MIPWFELYTFYVGPLPIQVWGFWVAFGILVSTVWGARRAQKHGIQKEQVYDFALWILVGAFIGARLFHVFLYEPGFYLANPVEFFKIWHGGMSSFGGFVGAAAGIWLFLRHHGKTWMKKLSFLQLSDLEALPLLVGWIIGRVGCVMIHDHPGQACSCVLAFDHPEQPFLDMAFLEILGLIPLLIAFILWRKKPWKAGWQLAALLMYYGVLRFILDFWRVIDTTYLGLTPAQYLSILMVAAGMSLLRKK